MKDKQINLKERINKLKNAGLGVWGSIFHNRNECAELIYILCNKLNPKKPFNAYHSAEVALDAINKGQNIQRKKYKPRKE